MNSLLAVSRFFSFVNGRLKILPPEQTLRRWPGVGAREYVTLSLYDL